MTALTQEQTDLLNKALQYALDIRIKDAAEYSSSYSTLLMISEDISAICTIRTQTFEAIVVEPNNPNIKLMKVIIDILQSAMNADSTTFSLPERQNLLALSFFVKGVMFAWNNSI